MGKKLRRVIKQHVFPVKNAAGPDLLAVLAVSGWLVGLFIYDWVGWLVGESVFYS
jgi:hypothetical protein